MYQTFNNGDYCFWVSAEVVDIWNTGGFTPAEKFLAGLAYVCSVVWGYSNLSSCDFGLMGVDVNFGSIGNNFAGSLFDNSINWLGVQLGLSNVPKLLACAAGVFGEGVLNPISIAYGGGSEEGASTAKKILKMLYKGGKYAKREVSALTCGVL